MKRTLIFVFTLACSLNLFAQATSFNCYVPDAGAVIRDHNTDFISLDLELNFVPEEGKVSGIAQYVFIPIQQKVDSVFLDAPGILIEYVLLDNSKTKFKMDSAGTTVFFNPPLVRNSNHTMTIKYDAYPKRGIYFNGWNNKITDSESDPTIIRKQIWTQGQGTDNRYWIPSYDGVNDKLLSSLKINFRSGYTIISNGEAGEIIKNQDGSITQTYKMVHPHNVYLIMLAIGKYDHLDYPSKNGITTKQYYYPGTKNIAEFTYKYSAEMMDWMEMETGLKYPWTTYANVPVQEFLYGAMENTTATIFSDYFYQDEKTFPDKNYVDINAHELTHQWFGDYVSAWSNAHQWLQESFATYYAKKFREHISGDDAYQWNRRGEMNSAFDADGKNNYPVAHSQAGSSRVYQKGSIVLDMLRYVTGDEQFKIVIKDFLEKYPYANVESHDFEMQFMRSLGINMDWFFDEWIYRDGFPEYTVNYTSEEKNIKVLVKQTQKQNETVHLFKMPIHVQVHYKDGSFDDQLVWIEKEETTINFKNTDGRELAFVLFDPNSMIYAKVKFEKQYEELKFQAFNAPNMIDRYDAIVALRATDIDKKRDDLIKLYAKENFHAIRSEIIFQLSNDDNKGSLAVMKQALNDADVLVRRAVLTNLQSIPSKLEKDIVSKLNDFNYSNCEIALYKLCTLNPTKKKEYLELTKELVGSNKNIRITWLELNFSGPEDKSVNELVSYSSSDYEFRTRNYAINSLVNLKYCNQQVVINLFDAALSTNNRLASPARNALKKLRETPAYADLIKNYYDQNFWDEWQKNKLKPIFN